MTAVNAPPPLSTPASSGINLANWWRNGWACRITVLLAGLAFLNLFETWDPDYRGAGYSQTQWEGNERVRREYQGTSAKGGGNAFTTGQGWLPLIGFLGTLFVCGKPRRSLGGLRWVPLVVGIVVFACVFDAFREQAREREQWLSRFSSHPVVTESAAMRWVILFSFGMIVSGAFFARRKGGDGPPPVPN